MYVRMCVYIYTYIIADMIQFDGYFSTEMGSQAAADAIHDAGLTYNDLQAAVASYCYGDPTCGQRALYGKHHLICMYMYVYVIYVLN